MAWQQSDALRNFMQQFCSFKRAFHGGKIEIYTGSQPANANAAVTGTLLVTITKASGAHTAEVLSQGKVTLTGGASGSVNTLTVNSINLIPYASVPFNTSLTQTCTDLAAAINQQLAYPEIRATASGTDVILTAMPGTGTSPNGWVVSGTTTTITTTFVNMGTTTAGVASANGLVFGSSATGVLSKYTTDTWSGVAVATGTAGWFRLKAAVSDAGSLDSSAVYIRADGSIATSGAQLNLSNTTITSGAVQTISAFNLTELAA